MKGFEGNKFHGCIRCIMDAWMHLDADARVVFRVSPDVVAGMVDDAVFNLISLSGAET